MVQITPVSTSGLTGPDYTELENQTQDTPPENDYVEVAQPDPTTIAAPGCLQYDDIINAIMLESGQFIIGNIDVTQLNQSQLELLIKRELAVYNRYFPMVATVIATLFNNKSFTMADDGFVPERIIQIRQKILTNFLFNGSIANSIISTYFWKYYKPFLYFNLPCDQYEMQYLAYHIYDETNTQFPTLTLGGTVNYFIDLCTAKFMIALGRSRRAFTIDELPISTDASELVSEGKELYEKTLEAMKINSSFMNAVIF